MKLRENPFSTVALEGEPSEKIGGIEIQSYGMSTNFRIVMFATPLSPSKREKQNLLHDKGIPYHKANHARLQSYNA
ncbi:hypothetical protein DICVIV_11265 [Dictyocaulus viviparus]|uniref:Uncharacterized protein n=1 Tax=Dictyocaulus viviparus TaxID=29172 RepID=A0A0D8XKA8_DICVI|nr:hypothetical protein DICVIV_11265 [Dictyocaulus viviparus]